MYKKVESYIAVTKKNTRNLESKLVALSDSDSNTLGSTALSSSFRAWVFTVALLNRVNRIQLCMLKQTQKCQQPSDIKLGGQFFFHIYEIGQK